MGPIGTQLWRWCEEWVIYLMLYSSSQSKRTRKNNLISSVQLIFLNEYLSTTQYNHRRNLSAVHKLKSYKLFVSYVFHKHFRIQWTKSNRLDRLRVNIVKFTLGSWSVTTLNRGEDTCYLSMLKISSLVQFKALW